MLEMFDEQKWINHVEYSVSLGKTDTSISKQCMSLDCARFLADRLELALVVLDREYVFSNMNEPDPKKQVNMPHSKNLV